MVLSPFNKNEIWGFFPPKDNKSCVRGYEYLRPMKFGEEPWICRLGCYAHPGPFQLWHLP